MAKRETSEINAGSMADIAFLLLIFFLVTTTMDVDTGIHRKLPPMPPENMEKPPPIKKKNIFTVMVNAYDQLLVEEQEMSVSELREATKKFINNNGDGSCDYCTGNRDKSSSDNPEKAVISLQNDRGTSYKMYIAVQNELAAAYNELREELSIRQHGVSFEDLDKEKQKAIKKMFPQKISEADPLDMNK